MKDSLELNLKAGMYTGMVLVGIVCLVLLMYCYPMIFPLIMVASALFIVVSFIFLIVRLLISDRLI
jgi:hypothetical protein